MTRWYHRLLPRRLRHPSNGDQAARQSAMEAKAHEQARRVAALNRELECSPTDEFTIQVRDALLRGM